MSTDSVGLKEAVSRGNRHNKRAVKAIVIPLDRKVESLRKQLEDQTAQSKDMPEDPFEHLVTEGQLLEPPFDLLTLAMLPEHNSELYQCIDAMALNIDGFGYRFVPRLKVDISEIPEEMRRAVKRENVDLQNFFAYACLADDITTSFTIFRKKLRKDLETTGNAWFEVIRSFDNSIQGFNHIPAYQMRLGVMESKAIQVDMPVLELQEDDSVKVKTIKMWRRFRMHAQSKAAYFKNMIVASSYELRWFKEFGDPRVYNNETGIEMQKGEDLPELKRANEIVHLSLYSPRTPYGLPRFIGNLLSIFGDRAAAEINYITFKNNNIPSMALVVSNGFLTDATVNRIESFVESQIQGSDNFSKFLIIEGESAEIEGEEAGQVKIDIKPLVKEQHVDELFQNYSKNNQDKVRRVWRLPGVFVGRTDDYSRNVVETSRRIADEQIFAPERDEFDSLMNRIIFPVMGIVYHKFKSNSPNTTDNTELVKILAGAEKTGGITPRIARIMLEDILSIELPEFPPGFPADVPFSMTMAEAVKNKADPTEPGQTVTALKMIEQLTGSDVNLFGMSDDELAERLLSMNRQIEKRWREQAAWTEE